MLQAYTGSLLLVGLTRENVNRLTDDQPIRIKLIRPVEDILVVFGETKPDIVNKIHAAGGPKFELSHIAAAEADPL